MARLVRRAAIITGVTLVVAGTALSVYARSLSDRSPAIGAVVAAVDSSHEITTDTGKYFNDDVRGDVEDFSFTLMSSGDIITYPSMNAAAALPDGSYDYSHMFDDVAAYSEQADLALCHLEIPIAPEGLAPQGYPVFGAPVDLLDGITDAGFDGCATATNHSVDMGSAGVLHTIDEMHARGLGFAGTAQSPEQQATAQMYALSDDEREVTVAHLAATYSTNGIPVAQPHLVDLIDDGLVVEQAAQARADGADVVVVSMHWGDEYTFTPNEYQRQWAQILADSGEVDLILGAHPHTPQPVEMIDGGPNGDGMWVVWSMGNAMASQQPGVSTIEETAIGLMVQVEITVDAGGEVTVTEPGWTPTVMDSWGNFALMELSTALADPGVTAWDLASLDRFDQHVEQVVDAGAGQRLDTILDGSGTDVEVLARGA